jgi:hypothetical protein
MEFITNLFGVGRSVKVALTGRTVPVPFQPEETITHLLDKLGKKYNVTVEAKHYISNSKTAHKIGKNKLLSEVVQDLKNATEANNGVEVTLQLREDKKRGTTVVKSKRRQRFLSFFFLSLLLSLIPGPGVLCPPKARPDDGAPLCPPSPPSLPGATGKVTNEAGSGIEAGN